MSEFYPNADGKYEYCYIKSEMMDALTWLNKLYSEGLIDADIASND
jgi:ABC-type glycerol-3-phosphate transport system substrate-binding protein